MILKAIKLDKKFIPEWNGNKSLPAAEQVQIHFSRIPGTSEKSNYKDFKFDSKGGVQLVYNDTLLISSYVERVENLTLEIDGELKKIKNGVDLSAASCSALSDLFTEIRNYLFPDAEDFTEGESKA